MPTIHMDIPGNQRREKRIHRSPPFVSSCGSRTYLSVLAPTAARFGMLDLYLPMEESGRGMSRDVPLLVELEVVVLVNETRASKRAWC